MYLLQLDQFQFYGLVITGLNFNMCSSFKHIAVLNLRIWRESESNWKQKLQLK